MTEHYYCFDTFTCLTATLTQDFLEDLGEIRLSPIQEPTEEALEDYSGQERTIVEISGLFFELE